MRPNWVRLLWGRGEYWSTGPLHPHPLRASADRNLPFRQRFERKLLQKDNSGRTLSSSLLSPGMKCGIAITVTRSGWLLHDDNTELSMLIVVVQSLLYFSVIFSAIVTFLLRVDRKRFMFSTWQTQRFQPQPIGTGKYHKSR